MRDSAQHFLQKFASTVQFMGNAVTVAIASPAAVVAVVAGADHGIIPLIVPSWVHEPRFPHKPRFGSTALLVTVCRIFYYPPTHPRAPCHLRPIYLQCVRTPGPRAPACQMVVRIVLCPCQQESRFEGTSQTHYSTGCTKICQNMGPGSLFRIPSEVIVLETTPHQLEQSRAQQHTMGSNDQLC